jgi:hypothetical protein
MDIEEFFIFMKIVIFHVATREYKQSNDDPLFYRSNLSTYHVCYTHFSSIFPSDRYLYLDIFSLAAIHTRSRPHPLKTSLHNKLARDLNLQPDILRLKLQLGRLGHADPPRPLHLPIMQLRLRARRIITTLLHRYRLDFLHSLFSAQPSKHLRVVARTPNRVVRRGLARRAGDGIVRRVGEAPVDGLDARVVHGGQLRRERVKNREVAEFDVELCACRVGRVVLGFLALGSRAPLAVHAGVKRAHRVVRDGGVALCAACFFVLGAVRGDELPDRGGGCGDDLRGLFGGRDVGGSGLHYQNATLGCVNGRAAAGYVNVEGSHC